MRHMFAAAAFSTLATASWAAPPVITENLTATIGGSHTVDTRGYFGPAGTDLAGVQMAIYFQYVPKLLGPSQECRNNSCTYNLSVSMPNTAGSLLITIIVKGHRLIYAPRSEAAIIFSTQSPYQLTIDSDAFSGFGLGLPGLQIATQFTFAPIFGSSLTPGNKPLQQASSSNYIDFFDASNQTPVEELTYIPEKGKK